MARVKMLTKANEKKLLKNYETNKKRSDAGRAELDLKQVVKLFNPSGNQTWLITEMGLDGMAFGLCDLGLGCPELGYVNILELSSFRGRFGLGIESDKWFEAEKTLNEYAIEAYEAGYIKA